MMEKYGKRWEHMEQKRWKSMEKAWETMEINMEQKQRKTGHLNL